MGVKDPTKRFSSRVENYLKYRPHYPVEVLKILVKGCQLTPEWVVADIGSGTGFLTELFLKNGNQVLGVEPNKEMREGGERYLRGYPKFTSGDGTAEDTRLPAASVDMVTAAQAFHWFDREKAKREFLRILRPRGWCAIVWNDRRTDGSPFLEAYERLLREFTSEYKESSHRRITEPDLAEFFAPNRPQVRTCRNHQTLDLDGLTGLLLSSSYAPEKGQAGHEAMLAELSQIFAAHQQDGRVVLEHDTRVYSGHLRARVAATLTPERKEPQ